MESAYSGKAGNTVAPASVAAHGYVNGRGPRDTSSAKQDAGDRGRDGADKVGGTEPRPRGFPPLPEAARQPDAAGCNEKKEEVSGDTSSF